MSWFRLDDQGAFHSKVLLAGNESYGAWCRAGQWSSAQRTDGVVPEQVARQIAPSRVWQKLIAAGLIEPRAASADPYVMHDFLEYNPSRSEVDERRSSRASAGKVGGIRSGEVRRGKQDASDLLPEFEANGKQGAAENRTPIPSRPDPVPDPKGDPEESGTSLAPSPLAPAPSQATPPTTSRSPATMPTPSQPLPTVDADPWGLTPTTPTPPIPAAPAKPRKPRAAKPVIAALTVEGLTPDERAVYDAIVQDVTLVQICHEVPRLARDLVAIATDRSGVVAINVIAEVRKAAGWNRDNAGTVKAWKTTGGNRGLRSWIERAMERTPIRYPSALPSPYAAPADHHVAPAPTIVDLAKNPELMPRPMRTARF